MELARRQRLLNTSFAHFLSGGIRIPYNSDEIYFMPTSDVKEDKFSFE